MYDSFETPMVLSLIVCDTVITDAQSGKKTLVGLFNSVGAARYPHVLPRFFIFASLANGNGEVEFRIRLKAGNGDTVFDLPGKVPFNTPLDAPEIVFDIQNLAIKSTGSYELQIVHNDIPIASRILTFRQIEPPQTAGRQPKIQQ